MVRDANPLGPRTQETQRLGREYMGLGLKVYRTPLGEKKMGAGAEVTDEELLATVFPHDAVNNVGVGMTGNRVDVEMDSPGSVAMADDFLPRTGAVFGRAAKPRSHRLYEVEDGAENVKRAGKVDVWTAGSSQRINFPPSLHPSDERALWDGAGPGEDGFEITPVRAGALQKAVRLLATADYVAGGVPEDDRHGFLQAVSGFLLRRGMEPDGAKRVLSAAWRYKGVRKNEAEAEGEVSRIVESAAERLGAEGGPVKGEPSLREHAKDLPKVIAKVWGWDLSEERVEELIERVEETGDPDLLDESAYDALAGVSAVKRGKARRRLKNALGDDLDLNDFRAGIKEAEGRKRARERAEEPTHDELRDRWLGRHPGEYAYGQAEWKRYESGV